ncbi:MAG: DNRLRE domain-containing protein [Burkholderiales bacterium]|nr:DNRLRE domain-containing protein [Phycisphaerae bacterium]
MDLKSIIGIAHVGLLCLSVDAVGAVLAINPTKDNTIYRESPENSNGLGPGIFVGNNANSDQATRRALIAFDVSSIPAGSVINSVSLQLYLGQENTGKPPLAVTMHALTVDWGQGTSATGGPISGGGGGTPATTGDATWDRRFYDVTPWTTAGGDFTAAASASALVGAEGSFYSWSSALLSSNVQAWVDQTAPNYGWLLRGDETVARTAKRFDSGESATPNQRPLLTINYTVPEPAGLAILACTAVIGLRRRRWDCGAIA